MKKISIGDLKQINVKYLARRMLSSATEQWYAKGDKPSEDRRRLLMSTYIANIIANMIGGSFFTGMLLLMNADDSFIGNMTMIAVAVNMLQLFAPLLLERYASRKRLLMRLRWILFAINILFIGLIPLFPIAQQAKLAMTAISIFVVNLINALISPGITVWHIQSIPPNVRSSFYALITMTVGAVVAICNLINSAVVDMFRAANMEYWGLLSLRVVAFGFAALDMYLYRKVEEYPYPDDGPNARKFGVRDMLVKPFRERRYLRTVAVTFLWNLAANIPGSYFTVYLLKNMEVSYTYIMLVNMINIPIVLFLTPVWRKLLTRFSWFKTLYIAMALYLLHFIGVAFVTKDTLWMFPVFCIWAYIMAIGINLSFTSIPYVNIPEKNQTLFIGFYSTAANFAAFLGVLLGKEFLLNTEGMWISVLGTAMMNKQILMLVTAGVMAIATGGIALLTRKQ